MLVFRGVTKTAAEPGDLIKGLNPFSLMYIIRRSSHQRGYRVLTALTQNNLKDCNGLRLLPLKILGLVPDVLSLMAIGQVAVNVRSPYLKS